MKENYKKDLNFSENIFKICGIKSKKNLIKQKKQKMKLNKKQLAKVKSIKEKMSILNKELDDLEKECYIVLKIDSDCPTHSLRRDWIFDYLYNDGDFVRCIENAGFEI